MKKIIAIALLLTAPAAYADVAQLRRYVTTLASQRFGGRQTGTDGERLAREFLVSELKRIGAKPLPGQRDFALPFEFTAGARDGGTTVSVPGTARALSFSDSGDVTAPVVFAGYGIVVPESQDFGYDSYATLDVKDKIVVVLRYFPEDADQKTRAVLARYSDLRYKAMAARQHGAKAMLVVTGPRSPNAGELVPMTFDTALSGSGIVAASIDGAAGNAILTTAGKTLADVQQSLDSGNPHVAGFEVPATLTVRAKVERERHTAYNVAAIFRRLAVRQRTSRGSASAHITITWGAAKTDRRWRRKKKPAASTAAPTTTRRGTPRSWKSRASSRSSRAPATSL